MSDWETDCEDWAEFYKRHPQAEVHLVDPPGKYMRSTGWAKERPRCDRCGYEKRDHGIVLTACTSFVNYEQRWGSTSLVRDKLHTETLFIGWTILALCRLVKTTATVSWQGHNTLISWLDGSGEPSRADGWRALASVGYVLLWAFAIAGLFFGVAALL